MRTPFTRSFSDQPKATRLISSQLPLRRCRTVLLVLSLLVNVSTFSLGQTLTAGMSFPAFRSSFITGAQVNIQATTTTPASTTVTKVEFFLATFTGPGGGKATVKLGEDLTAPFSYTWTIPDGQISYNELSVKVTNSTGATAVQGGTGYIRVDVYAPNTASNKKYYVSAAASATNTAGTLAAPFNTIQKAVDLVQPGDSVFVMAGTYTNTGNGDAVVIRRTGTPTNWIVFTNYQQDKPIVSFNGYQGFNLVPCAAYIKIQGFDVVGNNASVTLPQATTQPGSCDNPGGTVNPAFNGNGIGVNGRTGGNARPHHIVIANNTVHDCGGGGVSSIEGDYVTVENNTIYNNSWYTIFGTSGISFLNSWNYDTNTDAPKMIIRNNKCYGNRLFVRWINAGVCQGITDGNGIILDNNNNQFGTTNPNGAYAGKFLIENNLCYQNGGRGININYTNNATVLNNTCYQNAASPEITSEFAMRYSADARFYNNIFYARSDKAVGTPVNSANLLQNNNLTFGGTGNPFLTGNQNIVGKDPRFVDATNGNFQLMGTSPALNAGSSIPGQYALKDILGVNRPQGAGIDIGAFELQGIPPVITQQPASGSAVCVGASVSVSVGVSGPVQAYQWYKDGTLLTGVASATTATLTLPAVTPASQGSYVAVITGFTNLTSTAFILTVSALPEVPGLSTLSNQPYPGGQSSLTISQHTGPVVLVVSGCAGGIISWAGGSATALSVATTTTGIFSYSATCQRNGCSSPAAVATVTVVPTTLSVLHRDAGNGQLSTNAITPYLMLNNAGISPIPYSEVTVRYWLTAENAGPMTNLLVYYAQLGTDRVKMRYVALDQPRQGAYGYVEYSFDASAGSLAAAADSGPVDNRIAKQDYSNFDQGDDYSYILNREFTPNTHITAYRNGTLFWGQEPGITTGVQSLVAYTQTNNGPASNAISTYLQLKNTGTTPVPYGAIKVRYYFTADGPQALSVSLNYAGLGNANVRGNLVRLSTPLVNADTYLEWGFDPGLGSLYPGSNSGTIQYQITKDDYSYFDMNNDHSYQGTSPLIENDRVVVYVNGQRLYGQEPANAANARLSTEAPILDVALLGNPVQGDAVCAEVRGAEGRALTVELMDGQGKYLHDYRIQKAGVSEQLRLPVGRQAAGVLFLRVSTLTESQTVKVLKP